MNRLAIEIALGLVVVVLVLILAWNFDPFGRLKHAKADASAAHEAAASSGEAVKQLDHYTNTVTVIREKQDAAVQTVQAQPGASEKLPDGLRSAWAASIDGMRGAPSEAVPDRP